MLLRFDRLTTTNQPTDDNGNDDKHEHELLNSTNDTDDCDDNHDKDALLHRISNGVRLAYFTTQPT